MFQPHWEYGNIKTHYIQLNYLQLLQNDQLRGNSVCCVPNSHD